MELKPLWRNPAAGDIAGSLPPSRCSPAIAGYTFHSLAQRLKVPVKGTRPAQTSAAAHSSRLTESRLSAIEVVGNAIRGPSGFTGV